MRLRCTFTPHKATVRRGSSSDAPVLLSGIIGGLGFYPDTNDFEVIFFLWVFGVACIPRAVVPVFSWLR